MNPRDDYRDLVEYHARSRFYDISDVQPALRGGDVASWLAYKNSVHEIGEVMYAMLDELEDADVLRLLHLVLALDPTDKLPQGLYCTCAKDVSSLAARVQDGEPLEEVL
jgi:hypothetical protein